MKYTMQVRLFEDGVAYRFVLEGDPGQRRVPDEMSKFVLPAATTVWSHGLRGHYEGDYAKKDVAEFQKGEWAAPPVTFRLPNNGDYVAITESALINYSGMALESDGQRGFVVGLAHRQPPSYPYTLRYPQTDVERLSHPAVVTGTITMPWRVILVAKDLNMLVNSDVINDLAPPPDPQLFPQGVHTEWCKPGRAVWRYLDNPRPTSATARSAATMPTTRRGGGGGNPVTPAEMKEWSRLAGKLGFEYNVLEGFWRRWSDDELSDVVDYSAQQGVKLFVWVHSKQLHDPEARRELFQHCADLGVAGFKIDFFDHEHKETIDLYQAILRETAQRKLLVVFHGANKPTGETRTWPNELNREAIHGMEASRQPDRAFHETVLPFTRFLAGHGDYTPMLFTERRGNTTWAHQIALPVVFNETLITYGASPQHILENPAVDMIKSIPPTWDQTIVLPQSSIGEVAAYARRKGPDTWFLAVLNGNGARTLQVPLSFLGDGQYQAMIVRDNRNNPAAMVIERDKTFDRGATIPIEMSSGGGFVARFSKAAGSGDSK
jgi:alpha-glucosidase